MSSKLQQRVKSAGFKRLKKDKDATTKSTNLNRFLARFPMSESRVEPVTLQTSHKRRATVCFRVSEREKSPSVTSDTWRKVNSSRSEFRLKNLEKGNNSEAIRLNLMQKTLRIKEKHVEKVQAYSEQVRHVKQSHLRQTINQRQEYIEPDPSLRSKIHALIDPLERCKKLEDARFRERMLRIKRTVIV